MARVAGLAARTGRAGGPGKWKIVVLSMPPEPAPPMETRCRARPESICRGREGTWEQLGAQKRKIAVPSMPSEPAPPMETRCRARPESIYRGREGTWEQLGAPKRKIAVPSTPSEPAMPMKTRCRARPESIYRGPKPLVLARLVTGAGTNSSVNGFGPCPASGFHGPRSSVSGLPCSLLPWDPPPGKWIQALPGIGFPWAWPARAAC